MPQTVWTLPNTILIWNILPLPINAWYRGIHIMVDDKLIVNDNTGVFCNIIKTRGREHYPQLYVNMCIIWKYCLYILILWVFKVYVCPILSWIRLHISSKILFHYILSHLGDVVDLWLKRHAECPWPNPHMSATCEANIWCPLTGVLLKAA